MSDRLSFQRHAAFVGPTSFTDTVCIIGCGAVGSNFALLAAKMGVTKFKLWDLDIVEGHNLPNQAYLPKHLGHKKAEALAEVLKEFNPSINVEIYTRFFTPEDEELLDGILVIATDSMSSRKMLGEIFTLNPDLDYVFEMRMGFDYAELNMVDCSDRDACLNWQNSLLDDSEVPEGPCNLKICSTLVWSITSIAVHQLCNRYHALQHGKEWEHKGKFMLQMNELTQLYSC